MDCGIIPELEHGSLVITDGQTTYDARAEFSCNENYTLTGESKRVCTEDGTWSGNQPQCLCKYKQMISSKILAAFK